MTISLKQDEYCDPYVDINAIVDEAPESEAELYSRCVEEWASFLPPHVGGRLQLSTSWNRK